MNKLTQQYLESAIWVDGNEETEAVKQAEQDITIYVVISEYGVSEYERYEIVTLTTLNHQKALFQISLDAQNAVEDNLYYYQSIIEIWSNDSIVTRKVYKN